MLYAYLLGSSPNPVSDREIETREREWLREREEVTSPSTRIPEPPHRYVFYGYLVRQAIPLLGTWLAGGASLAMLYAYLLG